MQGQERRQEEARQTVLLYSLSYLNSINKFNFVFIITFLFLTVLTMYYSFHPATFSNFIQVTLVAFS